MMKIPICLLLVILILTSVEGKRRHKGHLPIDNPEEMRSKMLEEAKKNRKASGKKIPYIRRFMALICSQLVNNARGKAHFGNLGSFEFEVLPLHIAPSPSIEACLKPETRHD